MAADTIVTGSKLTAIANALRAKLGTQDTYTLDDIAEAIAGIPSGSGTDRFLGAIADYDTNGGLAYDFGPADYPSVGLKDMAFFEDRNVRSITLPAGEADFYQIPSPMFAGCYAKSITIPARTDGRSWEMVERNLNINASLMKIGYFRECPFLESMDLSNIASFANTAGRMFENCYRLTSVTLPTTPANAKLCEYDFRGCKKLSSIVVPDNFTSANASAVFSGCIALKTADFGTGIGALCGGTYGSGTFAGCTGMQRVILRSPTVVALSGYGALFTNNGTAGTKPSGFIGFYVPADLVDQYKAAANWSTLWADYIFPLGSLPDEFQR